MTIQFDPNETRVIVCYGPPASGKTTFARDLASQAKNPVWIDGKLFRSRRPLYTARNEFDLVLMDGMVAMDEETFLELLEWPTPKTFVLTFIGLPDFIPTDDDRVTVLEFPQQ